MNKLVSAATATAFAGTALIAILNGTPDQALAQRTKTEASKTENGNAVSADQELGKRFRISPEELPPPKATTSVTNGPLAIPFEAQSPKVPAGFSATLFAKLEHPRRLLVLPNGDIIVAEQKPGHLTLLRGKEGNGKAEFIERYAEGFNQPYGLAWREDHILIADQDGIWKIPHILGNLHRARSREEGCRSPT